MLNRKNGEMESAPIEQVVIEATHGLAALQLKALWQYRELLWFLVWRDVKVRYKQTALGVAWVVLQPVINMVVFSLLFGGLLKVPSGGVPYPVFSFAALLPWNYFSGAITRSGTSLVQSANLVSKVYFPRLVIPMAGVLAGLVDFGVGFLVFVVLMFIYHVTPTWGVLLLPFFLLLAMLTALAFGLWLSALNVRFRDINYLIPFIVQVWMYVTPVIYGSSLLPERFRWLLGLNPMTGVVEGFRWALIGGQMTDVAGPGALFWASVGIMLVVLVSGMMFFRSTEKTFADII